MDVISTQLILYHLLSRVKLVNFSTCISIDVHDVQAAADILQLGREGVSMTQSFVTPGKV